MQGDAFTTIDEPRLAMRLEQLLKAQRRLRAGRRASRCARRRLRATGRDGFRAASSRRSFPPGSSASRSRPSRPAATPVRRRRLVRWQRPRSARADAASSFSTTARRATSRRSASSAPARRATCRTSTGGGSCTATSHCQEPMWVEEKGTSADPADTRVVCGCGKPLSLQETVPAGPPRQVPRRAAVAARPRPEWLRREAEAAHPDRDQHLLSAGLHGHLAADRGGRADAARRGSHRATWRTCRPCRTWRRPSASIRRLRRRSGAYADDDIFERLQRIREGASGEFRTFAEDSPSSMSSPAGGRRSGTTIRPRSSTRRRCRARRGPTGRAASTCR